MWQALDTATLSMSDSTPHLVRTDTPEGLCALPRVGAGALRSWARAHWRGSRHSSTTCLRKRHWGDLRGLQWLDPWARNCSGTTGAVPARRLALDEGQRAMLERVARYSTTPPPPEPWRLIDQIDRLGVLVLHGVDHARHLLLLVGQMLLDSLRLLRAPRRAPWRDVSGHLFRMGATALPITALVGFLIGVVLAYLMSLQLRQYGAEAFIVNILGISLIRELGPMLAAILVAGVQARPLLRRSG